MRVAVGEDPRLALLAREQQQAEELARVLALKETEALDLNAMVDAWMADAVVRANDNKALRQASDKHILPKLGPTGAAQYGW